MFAVDQALAIKASGKISVAAIGQDCGELTGGRYLATLVQKKEGEGYFSPTSYKLTIQLADKSIATLSEFRADATDVLPANGGQEVIGEVRSVDSKILAITVKYDTDGKQGDEVWFISVLDEYPHKVVVSGSSVGHKRHCTINWFGTLKDAEQD